MENFKINDIVVAHLTGFNNSDDNDEASKKGGTGYIPGKIYKISRFSNADNAIFWQHNSGVWCHAARLATELEIKAYNEGITNIKDIKNQILEIYLKINKTMSKKAEVSVAGQFTEENIPNLLSAIDAKIKEITGDKDKANYVAIEIMGNKIADVKDPMKLRELYAYISKKEQAVQEFDSVFNQAALGIKLPTYKENGATVKQCQEAILTRFKEVTYEETLNKLKETKKALEECLSEEAKKKAKLQNAGESLANLLKIEL